MAGSMVYRLRVSDAGDPHMARLRDAMSQIQQIWDTRGFNHVAGYHGEPDWYCWHHQSSQRSPLRAQLFLPWHRAYMLELENRLRDVDDAVALPWWDWTTQRAIPAAYDQPPLDAFTARIPRGGQMIEQTTFRRPGLSGRLAQPGEITALMQQGNWETFSDQLQTIHDQVHVWVGGSMGQVSVASFDPVFYAHHVMIDRLWYLWQQIHGDSGIPQGLLDLPLDPFPLTTRDVLNVQSLGYEYAGTAADVPSDTDEEAAEETADGGEDADETGPAKRLYRYPPVRHHAPSDYTGAHLEIYGIDHYRPSYYALVFFDDPELTPDNASEERDSYVGSFAIFGHARCYGDEGHCDPPAGSRRFDPRRSHPLTKAFKRVDVSDGLAKVASGKDGRDVRISIVASYDPKAEYDPWEGPLFKCGGMQLVTFV